MPSNSNKATPPVIDKKTRSGLVGNSTDLTINKLQAMETQFNKMVPSLSSRMDNMEKNIIITIEEKLKNVVNEINVKIDLLQTKINQVENDFMLKMEGVEGRIQASESNTDTNGHGNLDKRLLELERVSKLTDVIVAGVPPESVDNQQIFSNICTAIKTETKWNDVGSMFRLRSGSIIIKFLSIGIKERFFTDYLKFKNLSVQHLGYQVAKRIFINESLSNHVSNLLKSALAMRKDGLIYKVYTSNGNLFIIVTANDRPFRVTTREQLTLGSQARLSYSF